MARAFNRRHSNPRVLVAQSVVGREGLNLHKSCKTVVLLHPEWNPGVVEQQIGRVDRVGSLWEQQLMEALDSRTESKELPRITVRPVVFRGTYAERNWAVLRDRCDDLRAQLHGVVISPRLGELTGLPDALIKEINACAPQFSPMQSVQEGLAASRPSFGVSFCPSNGRQSITQVFGEQAVQPLVSQLVPPA